ncbi:DUF3347 domain-containing protein [Kaistella palustris]|uniref:DUF3347 domain-containing protein n=1 Tax=Kaistella palustris TaxID=493376 RepID=UPI000429B894|nr:DUF3347 domain-containing protein [Kaistella palustris]
MKKYFFTFIISLCAFTITAAQQKDASVSEVFTKYLNLKNALVADNGDRAAKAADEFIKSTSMVSYRTLSEGNLDLLRQDATTIAESRSIEKQRIAFQKLSENMVRLSPKFKLSEDTVYVQYCPMAKAQWLSTEKAVKNPYYGSSMLTCGSVTSEVK